jgi:hypothetical protein
MRIFKKIFFILAGIFFLLISIGVGIAWYFEDNIKEIVSEELNKRIDQEKAILEIKDINLSLIKKFPMAAIDFENTLLKIKSSRNLNDTLLNFKHIYLEFSIKDLFEGNYIVKVIEVNEGLLKWMVDENGNDYSDVWQTSSDSASTKFNFALNKFLVKDFKLHYYNLPKKQTTDILIQQLFLKGNFSSNEFEVATDCRAYVNRMMEQDVSYIKDKWIDISMNMIKNDNLYEIEKGKLSIENQLLSIEGNVKTKIKKKSNLPVYELNLQLMANDLKLESIEQLFSQYYREQLKDYKSKGILNVVGSIKGSYGNTQSPEMIAGFAIKEAELTYVPTSLSMKKINLTGSYTNGKLKTPQSNCVEITDFSAQLGNGELSGKFKLKNFSEPLTSLSLSGKLSLEDWLNFIPVDSIESMSGNASFALNFGGQFNDSIRISTLNLSSLKTSGNINVSDFSLHIKNQKLQLFLL